MIIKRALMVAALVFCFVPALAPPVSAQPLCIGPIWCVR